MEEEGRRKGDREKRRGKDRKEGLRAFLRLLTTKAKGDGVIPCDSGLRNLHFNARIFIFDAGAFNTMARTERRARERCGRTAGERGRGRTREEGENGDVTM